MKRDRGCATPDVIPALVLAWAVGCVWLAALVLIVARLWW